MYSTLVSFLTLVQLCAVRAAASTLVESGFEGPSLSPFSACNVESPSFAEANTDSPVYSGSAKLETFFNEDYYDGTRDRKGAEICLFESGTTTNQVFFQKEGWQGFALYVPSSGYPDHNDAIIAQQFCPGGCSSWCATVSIEENSLAIDHRSACGTPTHATVVDSITRDEWHTIIVNIRLSNENDGHYVVYYDSNLVYDATAINVGFGDSWTNDILSPGVYFKNGIYAYDTANYTNTTRTLYFDNVSWYDVDDGATDGYNVVNPA